MNRRFPLDLESAAGDPGFECRRDICWPVSYSSILGVERTINRRFGKILTDLPLELGDALNVNFKLFFDYANIVNALRVLDSLRADGCEPQLSASSILFAGLVRKGAPGKGSLPAPLQSPPGLSARVLWFRRALSLHRRLSGSWRRAVTDLFTRPEFLITQPSTNPLLRRQLASKSPARFRVLQERDFFRPGRLREVERETRLIAHDVAQSLWDWYCREFDEVISTVSRTLEPYLLRTTTDLLVRTMAIMRPVSEIVGGWRGSTLLLGTGGSQLARLLGLAVKRAGGSAAGFFHGEPIIYDWDKYSWLELSTVDRFVVYNEALAGELRAVSVAYPPLCENQIEIVGAEQNTDIRPERPAGGSRRPAGRVRRVMIVPKTYAREYQVGQGISFPPLMQLDWELRLMRVLSDNGFRVIYKKHPDGILGELWKRLFPADVEVVERRFEECMDLADAFLFYHSRTTTMGPALCSAKPIVYIDGGWEQWLETSRTLFDRRCRRVQAWFDEGNRLCFDEDQLLDALTRPMEAPDHAYCRAYLNAWNGIQP